MGGNELIKHFDVMSDKFSYFINNELRVLFIINLSGDNGIKFSEIYKITSITKISLVKILTEIEKRNIIKRQPISYMLKSKGNVRNIIAIGYSVTEESKRMVNKLFFAFIYNW